MASVVPVAVAVLAAGQSRRFGEADKLAAPFRGGLLGHHVCATLGPLPFAHRWIIAADDSHPCVPEWRAQGFAVEINDHATSGIGSSVAVAARLARQAGVAALLVALADMPLVPASHFADLLEQAAPDALLASHNGVSPTPPALFGSTFFDELAQASGDAGARGLLAGAAIVPCDPDVLVDIDDRETLRRLA
ncbi:NTP transferase domain-containing protein [Parerythrobacter aurantius]|uniref:NTP transferase domain-containing protein n=1 Tax=Parerythrobacter aurantius TaxID=3127706 RepID=UPI00324F0259